MIDLFVRSRMVIYASATANRRYDAVQFTFSETVRGSDPDDIAVVLGFLSCIVVASIGVSWRLSLLSRNVRGFHAYLRMPRHKNLASFSTLDAHHGRFVSDIPVSKSSTSERIVRRFSTCWLSSEGYDDMFID